MSNAFFSSLMLLTLSSWTAIADPRLSYVNGKPQFNITENFFALYVGVWRGFDFEEVEAVKKGAALISQRQVKWQVLKCDSDEVSHEDQELIWTFDELKLDEEGQVLPVFEAWRPGFRYFSLVNLHGLHLRGVGDFKRPRRQPHETSEEFSKRIEVEKAHWWNAASPKATRGTVDIQLEMRLIEGSFDIELAQQFIRFEDYKTIAEASPQMREIFVRTAPSRWPVSYDERAHKPHSFFEPDLWRNSSHQNLRSDVLKARLEWNWCQTEKPLVARILVPRGGVLPPGPNRSGRTDHGPATIEVVETEGW